MNVIKSKSYASKGQLTTFVAEDDITVSVCACTLREFHIDINNIYNIKADIKYINSNTLDQNKPSPIVSKD